jgi:hypothetical protein
LASALGQRKYAAADSFNLHIRDITLTGMNSASSSNPFLNFTYDPLMPWVSLKMNATETARFIAAHHILARIFSP